MDYETSQELCDALSAPFPTEFIDWRVGPTNAKQNGGEATRGQPLCYIDARTVMERLDTICGIDGWQCNYSSAGQGSIVCNLGIRMPDGNWIWKSDGAGQTDMEADKGMLSDALKRAAVRFGIGRYLYDLKVAWIPLEKGKITEGEQRKLDEAHDKIAQRIGWGGPSDVAVYKFLLRIIQETVTQASDVPAFREKHKGMIPQLRVAMRRHLDQVLDQIGGTQREAAE